MSLLIVADENMPFAQDHFSRLGEVRLKAGRSLTPEDVREADMLMVRSVTKVNEALLAGSKVKFVGTATIGTDHVDKDWLASQGIGFSSAPGCNADSVAQWMAAALCMAAAGPGAPLAGATLGVVGVGNCGSRVARVARALGMNVKLNDPPLARKSGDPAYLPLEDLMDCDYLALHVPLTKPGQDPDPTRGLFNADVLGLLKPGSVLINACRGFVVDEAALMREMDGGRIAAAMLDAWENEPGIDPVMAGRALLATPHIAGYSFDGKVNGTRMIYEAACRHLGVEPEAVEVAMPAPATPVIEMNCAGRDIDSILSEIILTAYPIGRDSAALKRVAAGERDSIRKGFDDLRKNYPVRREFGATDLQLLNASESTVKTIKSFGFQCKISA